jgi:hypothetical protein
MGKIVRAYGWEDANEQRFVTINPLADEVSVYQTIHNPVSAKPMDHERGMILTSPSRAPNRRVSLSYTQGRGSVILLPSITREQLRVLSL